MSKDLDFEGLTPTVLAFITEHFDTATEVVYFLEKPWKWQTEFVAFRRQAEDALIARINAR